jgi:hypothetical protein
MGNLLIYSAAASSYIWLRAQPCCQPRRASLGRKPIRRGGCASSLAMLPAAALHLPRFVRPVDTGRFFPNPMLPIALSDEAMREIIDAAALAPISRSRGGRAC